MEYDAEAEVDLPQPPPGGEGQDAAEDDQADSATSANGKATSSTNVPSTAGNETALFSEFPDLDEGRQSYVSRDTNDRLTHGDRGTLTNGDRGTMQSRTSENPSFNRASFTQLGSARPSFQNGRISFSGQGMGSGPPGQDFNLKRISFSQIRRDQY